jgi:hypothetical protein
LRDIDYVIVLNDGLVYYGAAKSIDCLLSGSRVARDEAGEARVLALVGGRGEQHGRAAALLGSCSSAAGRRRRTKPPAGAEVGRRLVETNGLDFGRAPRQEQIGRWRGER